MSKEFQQHFGNVYMHGAGSNFIGIKERQLAVEVVSYMYQKLGDPLRVIEREREREI